MESQKIKENRRAKFLAKMQSQNNAKKKETNKNLKPKENEKSTILKNTQISQPNNNQSREKTETSLEPTNANKNQTNNNTIDNNIDLKNIFENINKFNNLFNENTNQNQIKNLPESKQENKNINKSLNIEKDDNNTNNKEIDKNIKNIINEINNEIKKETPKEQKINYNEIMEKINKFDSMLNFQNIIKKILIIILSIIHCLKNSLLDNNIVKYTLIIIEISSFIFNRHYNDQKKKLTNNNISQKNQNNFDNVKPSNKSAKIAKLLIYNFEIFNNLFFLVNVIKDIIADISILFFINICFLIITKKQN